MQSSRVVLLVIMLVRPAAAEAQSLFRAKGMAVHDGDTDRVLREEGRLTDVRLWSQPTPTPPWQWRRDGAS